MEKDGAEAEGGGGLTVHRGEVILNTKQHNCKGLHFLAENIVKDSMRSSYLVLIFIFNINIELLIYVNRGEITIHC